MLICELFGNFAREEIQDNGLMHSATLSAIGATILYSINKTKRFRITALRTRQLTKFFFFKS